ncbi:unnamed protein product [Peronospora belbahrii]|uniref:PX domain-containing protein n=1 Tax=Peronospora belbahrii TaxID=622444 RepID=A0AAU9L5K1_9STRA|nr:unnamed protein product [Peronospora belbahrii]
MKTISAHVTGFYRSSFHAYTTEVTVDGHRWRLGLRYSKFHDFYDQLMVQEKDFHAEFPPKGTLFFTPKPEERQEQLELFLQQVLAYYSSKTDSIEMENLLCDLLKVPRHLRSSERDDDNVSTSTESAQDEPMHEPVIEKKNDEKEKTQVADTTVDLALHVVATETVKEREKVVADVKEGEKDADLSELMQPVSPVANESRSVELTEEAKIALDAVEAEVEIRVEESEAAKEMVKEDVAVR